jgi:hyperosmotically inducible protein
MRKLLIITACFVIVAVATGCTTIYKAAVDERSISTIASDTKIKAGIMDAYVEDENLKALDFFVGVYDGDVYLVGAYKTTAQRDRAVAIARKTENVKGVDTYMIPAVENHPCTTKVNLGITVKIKGALAKDTDIWSTNIDVKTVQCNVVLVGLVGTKVEVTKAIEHAKAAEKVRKVKSFLKTSR